MKRAADDGSSSDGTPSDRSPSPESLIACLTGSLHEELSLQQSRPANVPRAPGDPSDDIDLCVAATESRPCYRCVAHMHSVGIKRVFWTDTYGRWQVSKVRDLIERIHRGAGDLLNEPLGMFVTKHEVLIRKRRVSEN